VTSTLIYNSDSWYQLLDELNPSAIAVLTDSNTEIHCLPFFASQYLQGEEFIHLSIEPGEASKSIDCAQEIWSAMLEDQLDRKALFISLGGGVVTDLGGFVASAYKRGIQCVHVPTTHLGMTDAALGGKNGVNFDGLKNQIGTIRQPKAIIIDDHFLGTLSNKELRNGFMETIKHALIADANFWKEIAPMDALAAASDINIIRKSAAIKQRIIEMDQDDFGIRQSLNFGHTVGHVLESMLGISHGASVAFGILAESFISSEQCELTKPELNSICEVVTKCLRPAIPENIDVNRLAELMNGDKKNEYGKVRFSLISNIGISKIGETVPIDLVKQSIAYALIKMK